MNTTKVIIICAGEGERWGGYLGVPKHLLKIDGEKLIERTVRLLRKHMVNEIYIVSKPDLRYEIKGSTQYIAKLNITNGDADKFLSSKELWNQQGRTIVLYGDCYFSEEAIEKIIRYKLLDWTLFCRPWKSEYTGCEYGECFAQSFYSKDLKRHEDCLYEMIEMKNKGLLSRCGGWEHFMIISGLRNEKSDMDYSDIKMFIIDDWTEDFDTPEDYDKWMLNRQELLKES